MTSKKQPPLKVLALHITSYLKCFEADPKVNVRAHERWQLPYYHACAYVGGRYVRVVYVSYQGATSLTRDEAVAYVAWLRAGNIGKHWDMQRAENAPRVE